MLLYFVTCVCVAFFIFFGLGSTQLACRVQPKRKQVEAQY